MAVNTLPDGAVRLPNGKILTADDIAEQRAAKERRKAQAAAKRALQGEPEEAVVDSKGMNVKHREWIDLDWKLKDEAFRFRLATWNILAQTLVRRELFPGSDCLKFKDRKDMLAAEVLAYPADILCLQECDQLEFFASLLPSPAYQHVSARGPKKLHGLVIIFRTEAFRLVSTKTIYLDEEELQPSPLAQTSDGGADGQAELEKERKIRARGGTRQTKNVCLMVLLESNAKPGKGLLVATTHLFWHPHYSYERTRQSLILVRSAKEFRDQHDPTWPIVLAGDLNTSPSEPNYHLLVQPNIPLDAAGKESIDTSRAIHISLPNVENLINPPRPGEASAPISGPTGPPPLVLGGKDDEKEDDEAGEGEGGDAEPERMKNTRTPEENDGLLTAHELQAVARDVFGSGEGSGAISAYGSSGWQDIGASKALTYGSRSESGPGIGDNEPNWTSYTPLWHLTLDYILDVRTSGTRAKSLKPMRILAPHRTEDLGNGLPKKGICASDHVMLGVEYELS